MDEAAVLPARQKLDVETYQRMGECGGILEGNNRIELINGELFDMAPTDQGHAGIVNKLNETLVNLCQGRAIVSVQNPVRLDNYSEPQPDFAILRWRADFYETGEPASAADVLLLIEVADTSLNFDRTVKLPLYARAGIPEYWIIDKKRRTVDVHTAPADAAYTRIETKGAGNRLVLTMDPEIAIDLHRILG